jgi:hypothetical protein
MNRDIEPAVIARLRAELSAQVAPPLAVSAKSTQYREGEEFAAYCDIDVKQGDVFAVVVVQGSLPFEELVVRIWHRRADEVWLVDRSDQAITIVRQDGTVRVFGIGETIRSTRLPKFSATVASIFGITN